MMVLSGSPMFIAHSSYELLGGEWNISAIESVYDSGDELSFFSAQFRMSIVIELSVISETFLFNIVFSLCDLLRPFFHLTFLPYHFADQLLQDCNGVVPTLNLVILGALPDNGSIPNTEIL